MNQEKPNTDDHVKGIIRNPDGTFKIVPIEDVLKHDKPAPPPKPEALPDVEEYIDPNPTRIFTREEIQKILDEAGKN